MLTVAVATFNREAVLIDTLRHFMRQEPRPGEILVVDQTVGHEATTEAALEAWQKTGSIRRIRQAMPSVARAMNAALLAARNDVVLFVDDDVVPEAGLLAGHLHAHATTGAGLVAGRVIQPWQEGRELSADAYFHLAGTRPCWVDEFIGCNFSVRRGPAMAVGGFDENFVRVAYRFEAEFAFRLQRAGHRIYFEPDACLHHLKADAGGTRSFGGHLTSIRPDHAVGAYYCELRTWRGWDSLGRFLARPARAVGTRHHLRRPWWIPATLVGELTAMGWALALASAGPRYVDGRDRSTAAVAATGA